MNRFHHYWQRLLFFLRREKFERELEEEMSFHLEMKAQEYVDGGMSPEEARYAARRQFGNLTFLKEESREMWGFGWLETLFQDIRYGLRMMRRDFGFTTVAVLSLALGIGANTAIFSLIDSILLKMLPVKDPKQLVVLKWTSGPKFPARSLMGSMSIGGEKGPTSSTSFSVPAFEQFRDNSQGFTTLFAFQGVDRLNVNIGGQAELARGQVVSGDYYTGLGVQAIIGRTLTREDDKVSGADPVAVLSYNYWQGRFGGDPSVIGKTIFLNGNPFTIIGVAPRGFLGTLEIGESPDITVPISMQAQAMPGESLLNDPDNWWVQIIGRLKPGVPEQQTLASLDLLLQQTVNSGQTAKDERDPAKIQFIPGSQGLSDSRKHYSQPLFIMMCVVGLVLLIACTNVANLLLARAEKRQKEIAVRLALGAGRLRLIRQLLTESLLLSVIGGTVGLLLAFWGKDILLRLLPGIRGEQTFHVVIDTRILVFTAALSLLTGVLFGLIPALRATRLDLNPALKATSQGLSKQRSRFALSKILVVAQVAMSLLLLIGAGLFVRTLQNLENVNAGFNPNNVLLFRVDPKMNGYKGERLVNLYKEMLESFKNIPGVRSASMSQNSFISGGSNIMTITVPGFNPPPNFDKYVYANSVSTDFFRTMEIPILSGRHFSEQDNEKVPRVTIINEEMARIYFPNENPVGKRFFLGSSKKAKEIEIVGIAGNTKYASLRDDVPPTIFIPYLQDLSTASMCFELRLAGNSAETISAIRSVVQTMDKNLPLFNVKMQLDQMMESITQERQFARLSSFFGLLALILACIGLYGIMSYSVVRRTNEIGIRMALGALRKDVIWMIMRETLLLILIGVVIGISSSFAATKIISSMMFGLTTKDPITLTLATLLLVIIVAVAGYLPARRAAKVDPMVALRYE